MSTEITTENECKKQQVQIQGGGSDTFYGLGLIGAWIFFISRAQTPQDKLIGFLKGFIWPVLLVKAMLEFFIKDEE